MESGGIHSTVRRLIYALPILMGAVEYLLRVGFRQTDKDAFFPISLTVAGIGLFVALRAISDRKPKTTYSWQERCIAGLSLWMALIGVVCWVYLLMASFSKEVREIADFSPYLIAGGYYFLGTAATERMAGKS